MWTEKAEQDWKKKFGVHPFLNRKAGTEATFQGEPLTDFSIIDGYKARGYIVKDTPCGHLSNEDLNDEEVSERWQTILVLHKNGASKNRIAHELGYYSYTSLNTFIEKYPIKDMPKGLAMCRDTNSKPCACTKDIKHNSDVINIQDLNKYTYRGKAEMTTKIRLNTELIKAWIKKNKFTQRKFAVLIGVPENSMTLYLRKNQMPDMEIVSKIAFATGHSVKELLIEEKD